MTGKKRKKTRSVKVGRLVIGNGFPISVQSMWKEPLHNLNDRDEILKKISALEAIGCELLRFSVPDIETAKILGELASLVDIPLIADIHYDYRIALKCLDYAIAKIRINPGNIGKAWKVEELVHKACDRNIPIRIGVNSGSLPKILKGEADIAAAMVKAAEMEMEIIDKLKFNQVIFSLKSSDIENTVEANLLFSEKYNFPLHIGVTEAGPLVQGIVKNSIALSRLLKDGVGDTLRVSLSDSMENEILSGRAILRSAGSRSKGIDIISCPTCGRKVFDVKIFLENVKNYIHSLDKNLTIAVMGCPVNGPGEARHADLGITGSGNFVLFFKKGNIIRREPIDKALDVFKEEVDKF